MSSYNIANIALEVNKEGKVIFWLNHAGVFASQGGKEPGYESVRFDSLEDLCDYYPGAYERQELYLLAQLENRERMLNNNAKEFFEDEEGEMHADGYKL